MSEPEDRTKNFLRRWSRRKRAAATRERDEGVSPNTAKTEIGTPADITTVGRSDPAKFDPTTLPPIESISAATDVRPFLAPNVPIELSRAALRRAWLTDPTIRDFIGIAENQWDFNAPDGIPGFGSLQLTPELRRTLTELVGNLASQTQTEHREDREKTGDRSEAPRKPLTQSDKDTAGYGRSANSRSLRNEKQKQTQLISPAIDNVAPQNADSASHGAVLSERKRHGRALPK